MPVQAADPAPVPPVVPPAPRHEWDPHEELLPYEEAYELEPESALPSKAWIYWVLGAVLLVGLVLVLLQVFETDGDDNWMGLHFFTGGLMPAADTLPLFQRDLRIDRRWVVDGTHYQRTANHWLQRQDSQREAVMAVLRQAYGEAGAALWFQRWRMFWMACAEMFGLHGGQEWGVGHYRFVRPE